MSDETPYTPTQEMPFEMLPDVWENGRCLCLTLKPFYTLKENDEIPLNGQSVLCSHI